MMTHSRRNFLKTIGAAGLALHAGGSFSACSKKTPPNILWLIAEDVTTDFGCYGEPLVRTPNIDRLAGQGARYTNAFTTSPVCSPSRSAFMTGMYQTSIGAHNHRSHRRDGYKLPKDVHVITEYFRRAGYFTANVVTAATGVKGSNKTDWNFTVENPFDGTDWNQREPGQPFFAQVNFKQAHRVFIKAGENPVDPANVKLPPYYPNHPVAREDWARYLDTIGALDRNVGAVLRRLEEEDLAENTIVFFFADHGRAMVRAKQWLYDPGIHIPLIIRWPGVIEPGAVNDELISAIDIAATSLKLAGVTPPSNMQGRAFLSAKVRPRDYIIAARDRCDETVDRIRCVRSKRFKYIRNYYPERPWSQLNRYKETEYPVLRLMRRLYAAGKLSPAQALFMAPNRPAEELYDLRNDPHEIKNLAKEPEYAETMKDLRHILNSWIQDTGDQGAIAEDSSVIEYYENLMKQRYDQRLRQIYADEGMIFND